MTTCCLLFVLLALLASSILSASLASLTALLANEHLRLASCARFHIQRFSEDVTEDMVTKFRLNRILFDSKSEFQRIQVPTVRLFKRALLASAALVMLSRAFAK
jgi:hypothetical protein